MVVIREVFSIPLIFHMKKENRNSKMEVMMHKNITVSRLLHVLFIFPWQHCLV